MFVEIQQDEGLAGGTIGRIITAVVSGGVSEVARAVSPTIRKQLDQFNVGVGHFIIPNFSAITKDIGRAITHPLKALFLPVTLTTDVLVKPELKGLQEIGNAASLGGFKPIKFVTNLAIQPLYQTVVNVGDRPGRTLANFGRGIPSIVVAAGTGFASGLLPGAIIGGGLQLAQVGKKTEKSSPNLVQQVVTGVGSGVTGGGIVGVAAGIKAAGAALEEAASKGLLEGAKDVGKAFLGGVQSAAESSPVGKLFSGLSTAEKLGVAFLGQTALSMATPRQGPAPIDFSQAAVYDTSANAAQGPDQAVTPPPPPGVVRDYGTGAVPPSTVIPPVAPTPGKNVPPLDTISTTSPLVPQQPAAVQAAVQAVQQGGVPATSTENPTAPPSVGIGAAEKTEHLINLGPAPALVASGTPSASLESLAPLGTLKPLGTLASLEPPASTIAFIGVMLVLLVLTSPRRRAA